MSVQPRLITLNEYNPRDKSVSSNDIIWAKFLAKDEFAVIDDGILEAIVEVNKQEGEDEIIKMADRGQISLNDAMHILGNKYEIVAKRVSCEWVDS